MWNMNSRAVFIDVLYTRHGWNDSVLPFYVYFRSRGLFFLIYIKSWRDACSCCSTREITTYAFSCNTAINQQRVSTGEHVFRVRAGAHILNFRKRVVRPTLLWTIHLRSISNPFLFEAYYRIRCDLRFYYYYWSPVKQHYVGERMRTLYAFTVHYCIHGYYNRYAYDKLLKQWYCDTSSWIIIDDFANASINGICAVMIRRIRIALNVRPLSIFTPFVPSEKFLPWHAVTTYIYIYICHNISKY